MSGSSGSGKTSLGRRITRELSRAGVTVSFIKSTHHPLNTDPTRGDTRRMLDAGACEAFLVNGSEAVRFDATGGVTSLEKVGPRDLVSSVAGEVVLIEGWREYRGAMRIDLARFDFRGERAVKAALEMLGREREERRYRGVIFDLDGTLLDSWDALHIAVNEATRVMKRPPIDRDRMIANVGEGVEALLVKCLDLPDGVPSEAMERFVEVYDAECCNGSQLLPGARELIAALQRRNVRMAVCTNKPTRFSSRILECLGALEAMTGVIGPDLIGVGKPDPRPVLAALEATGAPVREALFVGDMPIDVEASRAAGLDVAVLPTGSSTHAELLDADPDYLLESLDEVLDYV